MGSLQILLKKRQEINNYLYAKSLTIESLAYKAELKRYDIRVEPLNDDFNAILAGLQKLPRSE